MRREATPCTMRDLYEPCRFAFVVLTEAVCGRNENSPISANDFLSVLQVERRTAVFRSCPNLTLIYPTVTLSRVYPVAFPIFSLAYRSSTTPFFLTKAYVTRMWLIARIAEEKIPEIIFFVSPHPTESLFRKLTQISKRDEITSDKEIFTYFYLLFSYV